MANAKETAAKWYKRPWMARIAVLVLSAVALAYVGVAEKDLTKTLLALNLMFLVGALLEIVLGALRTESLQKDLTTLTSAYHVIHDKLSQADRILPELKVRLESISHAYEASRQMKLSLFGVLADTELAEFEQKMNYLKGGHYRLAHQRSQVVHRSWAPLLALAEKGDIVIATSDVTPEWWDSNPDWLKANKDLIDRGAGLIRIFFLRSLQQYDGLRETMRHQARVGVQVNWAWVDDVTKIGKKTRDVMLVKAQISDINNPLNAGKVVARALALGEQDLLDDHTDWESLSMTDDSRAIAEQCHDLTEIIGKSVRFEDDSWAADFFDKDLHQIMASKDPDTPSEVKAVAELLSCETGSRYLDLGAGYGRIAVPLAMEYPVTVVAVEQSNELLDELQRDFERKSSEWYYKNRKVQGNLVTKNSEIRQLAEIWKQTKDPVLAPESFDGAISVFDSFGYYQSDEENRKVLEVAANLLKPDGLLILDLINPRQVSKRVGSRDWGRGVSGYGQYDDKRRRFLESYMLKNTVFKFKPLVSLRIYDLREINDMLTAAGFDCGRRASAAYGSLALPLKSYDDHSPRMVIVARKRT